ncbi:MAG: 3-phosphoshikimate 1-carboxyvinyltransferase, partial [Deferribacterales bacterium]
MISFSKIASLKGNVVVPADKSITHRSIIFSAMAEGNSEIIHPLISRDTLATMNGMKAVGVEFIPIESGFKVVSKGYKEFKEADNIINCENSGTTARLLTGLFAPQKKYFVFTGDDSLRKRPMDRVQKPLYRMGANIVLRGNRYLPMTILPSDIYPAEIEAEVNSAQVKSAVLLAGCQIEGVTSYLEKEITRNHTEMMLKDLGAEIVIEGKKISIKGPIKIKGERFVVPGDFSSAAFFIGSALMFENAEIVVKGVGLNPTRTGLIDVLRRFGVNIELSYNDNRSEPTGDIYIKNQRFSGGKIAGDIIPNIIDEIPLIATLGLFADSPIEIRDAEELRVKES